MKDFRSLKKNTQFRAVYQNGESLAERLLVLYWLPNGLDYSRFGFSLGKKVGKAVVRNRYKRILREICRNNSNLIRTGFDCVVIARPRIVGFEYFTIEKGFKYLLKKSGLDKVD